MEEHDRLEDANKLLVQTLELVLIGLGLVVLHYLGIPLLIPMIAGLILFLPCACLMQMLQHHSESPER